MDVINTGSNVGDDLQSRHPARKHGEIRVSWVSQSITKINALDKLVNEVNIIPGNGDSLERDQTRVVAPAYHRHPMDELRSFDRTAELPLSYDDVPVANRTPPRGGRG